MNINSRSTFVTLMVGLGVASFALSGIGGMGGGMDSSLAAEVGSQQISIQDLSDVASQMDRQSGNDKDRKNANLQNAMNQLIQQRLILEEADKLGWTATDLEVADWIKQIPQFQNKDTKKFELATYNKWMKSGQMTELGLYAEGRQSVTSRKFFAALSLPDHTPAELVKAQVMRDQVEFDFEYAEIKPDETKLKTMVAAEAQTYAADKANESKIKEAFEQRKLEFNRPAQVSLKSILVGYKEAARAQGDALNRTEAQAKALADTIRTAAAKNFDAAATKQNDDPIAKAAAGNIGFVDTSKIDAESAKIVFSLNKQNPLSGVVKTPAGFRIYKFVEARAAVTKTLDQAKLDIATGIVSQPARVKLLAEQTKEFEAAIANPSALMSKYGMTFKKIVKPVSASTQFLDELGLAEPVLKHMFQVKKPGDYVPAVLDFASRKVIMRLVARRDGTTPDQKKLDMTARMTGYRQAQTFVDDAQKKLLEQYTRENKIKRNMSIFEN